jgi:hypothetical protein
MHKAAALYWASGDSGASAEYLQAQSWPLDAKHTAGMAMQCWASYAAKAKPFPLQGGDYNNWDIVALEQRILMPVEYSDVQLAFQIDRLVQCPATGRMAFVDIKTTRRVDSKWIQQWNRDLQMKLYAEAIRKNFGRAPEYIVIEAIDKSSCQYSYIPVAEHTPSQLAEAWRQFLWVAHHDAAVIDACTDSKGIVNVEALVHKVLVDTPHNTGECFSYGRPCPFLRLCDAPPEERMALLQDGYSYVEPEWL